MDTKYVFLGLVLLLLITLLSGCEEKGVTTENDLENILFESDVVELDRANLEFIKDDEEFDARKIDFNYRLHNPLNRSVSVNVDVIFYDETDRELYSKLDYEINLPAGHTDSINTVEFGGIHVKLVDYVKITAFEK